MAYRERQCAPLPPGCCKVTLEVLNSGNEGAKALYQSEGFVFEVRLPNRPRNEFPSSAQLRFAGPVFRFLRPGVCDPVWALTKPT